jgi:hypothetical protein
VAAWRTAALSTAICRSPWPSTVAATSRATPRGERRRGGTADAGAAPCHEGHPAGETCGHVRLVDPEAMQTDRSVMRARGCRVRLWAVLRSVRTGPGRPRRGGVRDRGRCARARACLEQDEQETRQRVRVLVRRELASPMDSSA